MNTLFFTFSLLFLTPAKVLCQGSSGGTDCVLQCRNQMLQQAPKLDPVSVLNVAPVTTPNGQTAQCPKMDKTNVAELDKSCKPYIDAKKCLDACPQSSAQWNAVNSLKGLQFVCIDRIDDVKKHMPCLSEVCPKAQEACTSCGSFDTILKGIKQIQAGGGATAAGNAEATTAMAQKVIGQSCASLDCLANCTKDATVAKCGYDAYVLSADLPWAILQGIVVSLRQIGVKVTFTPECKSLAQHVVKLQQSQG